MKKIVLLILIVAGFTGNNIFGQKRYTPYDDLPEIIKSYKPSYSNSYPDWAKMLYRYPVNYNVINNSFEKYKRTSGRKECYNTVL